MYKYFIPQTTEESQKRKGEREKAKGESLKLKAKREKLKGESLKLKAKREKLKGEKQNQEPRTRIKDC